MESYCSTPASAGASVLASALVRHPQMLKFLLMFLRPHYFLTLSLICFIFDMMIHIGPNFARYHPHYSRSCQGRGHRLRIFMLKSYVKIFRISLLLHLMVDFVPIWYYGRHWSKVFISTISTHDHDLEVEVTDLEFKC